MKIDVQNSENIFERSVQINNGLKETSGDGAGLYFDKQYGIMFCAYMPGFQGRYGESRGKVCLSYFPATQPTNIKFVEIAKGNMEYCNNILGLSDGKVRVFYEKDSVSEGDHDVCYKDFDFINEILSEEKAIMVKTETEDKKLCYSLMNSYVKAHGFDNQTFRVSEQIIIGGCTFYKEDDGYTYGAVVSYLSQCILFRSADDMATLEFFAVCPFLAQYEFDFKIKDGKIYTIFRTNKDKNSVCFTTSEDMGKTWSEPIEIEDSIQCRPRLIHYNGSLIMAYNYFNDDTGYRPKIQQGRTSVRIRLVDNDNPNLCTLVADLYNKCGLVNISLEEVLGDLYMAYSTSEAALEYQNGNPMVRGKDAIRYVKLGHLTAE